MSRLSWVTAAVFLLLCGCGERASSYTPSFAARAADLPEFTFAVHPLSNPTLLHETYGPLINYLNARVPEARFVLVASRDYASFEERLVGEQFSFALPNPYQTLMALDHGYRVFAKVGDDDLFRGLILVRRDGRVKEIDNLKGAVISYPAPTALAAAMLPQQFLHDNGVPLSATRTRYVGSQESSIESVVAGDSDAAATWAPPWDAYAKANPERASAVEVKWRTPPLVNNGLVAHASVPEQTTRKVSEALWLLPDSAEGRRILSRIGTSRFEPATAATYAPVRRFVAKFESEVRPVQAGGEARP